ncbi:MAG: Gfo/Idh/MocA family protein [Candidatus Bathyarchaeia archaeon]
MASKVNVGIIGVGGWGRNHARVYHELPQLCRLTAICDANESLARSMGEKYGVEWYSDVESFLQRERDMEAVSISTPTPTHYHLAKKAIESGRHVLLEKSATASSVKLRELKALAESRRVKLMVGFIERFNTGVQKAKDMIANGELGSLRYVSACRISPWAKVARGVGVIMDVAIHDIDILRYLIGEEPHGVYAEVQHYIEGLPPEFETSCQLSLSYPSGVTAHLVAEWISPRQGDRKRVRQLTVTGSEGTAILSYIPQLVWRIDAVDVMSPFLDAEGRPRYTRDPGNATLIEPLVWEEPLRNELSSFLRCILDDAQPSVTATDGIRVLEIAEAALQSAAKHAAQKLNLKTT